MFQNSNCPDFQIINWYENIKDYGYKSLHTFEPYKDLLVSSSHPPHPVKRIIYLSHVYWLLTFTVLQEQGSLN